MVTAAAVLLLLLGATLAQAQSRSGAPSLHDVVTAAWARNPQRQALAARQSTAAARLQAGGALFPNAPTFNGTYVNDKIAGSNYNYITSQAGFDAPIWLPGEGTATQNVARAEADVVYADEAAAHLALASDVLDLAAQANLAANTRDVAARRLASARALAADAARRWRVGEGSESDALAASAEAASAQLTLSMAEGQAASALSAFAALTGTAALPALSIPPGADRPIVGGDRLASHPLLVAAQRAVMAAQEQARLVGIENRDNPQIGLVGINEKQPGARWDTRFGVVLHFPFATEARNAPRRAAAEQAVTQAVVQLDLARRRVEVQVQQADAVVTASEAGLTAARRAAADLDKRSGQIERAWKLGEMPLIEVIRANSITFDADLARDKALTAIDAARQRRRLAQGLLP